MEIFKKFLSRKFLMSLGGFVFSVLAVLYGDDNFYLAILGQVGVVVFPLFYMFLEAYLDGKSIEVAEVVPDIATTVNDLVQIYEDNFGESGVTNFIQDMTDVVNKHFGEKTIEIVEQEK